MPTIMFSPTHLLWTFPFFKKFDSLQCPSHCG